MSQSTGWRTIKGGPDVGQTMNIYRRPIEGSEDAIPENLGEFTVRSIDDGRITAVQTTGEGVIRALEFERKAIHPLEPAILPADTGIKEL
jgi:hypothetical protein